MEGMEYFYELYESLPRCGPGDNVSTRRAFNAIPDKKKKPFILDIGCGTGVQTIELARASNGTIVALDNHQAFLDTLMKTAGQEGLADHIILKNVSMLDMNFEENTFDIIWSEGALYFMGFQNGLKRCRQLLKDDGYLAVTELVYLSSSPPAPVSQYLENEYPDIKDVKGNIDLIKAEGFRMIKDFVLSKSAWLKSYYAPIEMELTHLIEKYQGNEIALGVFKDLQVEIDFYKKYSDYFGYGFFVMQKAG